MKISEKRAEKVYSKQTAEKFLFIQNKINFFH
jgi:hypothetical protein